MGSASNPVASSSSSSHAARHRSTTMTSTEVAQEAGDQLLSKVMYDPGNVSGTRLAKFQQKIAEKYRRPDVGKDYESFWAWSCEDPASFWRECWDEVDIIASVRAKDDDVLPDGDRIYPPPKWFVGARLNVAENLLRHSLPGSELVDKPALIQATEPSTEEPENFLVQTITQSELRRQVAQAVRALRQRGVVAGDRVASYASNCSANVVAFLATAAIGAIWISAAADFAPQGVLERLTTVRPKVLFAVNAVRYNGKLHDHTEKVRAVVDGLDASASAEEQKLEGVILIPYMASSPTTLDKTKGWASWGSFLKDEGRAREGEDESSIDFAQLDFNHPLWILFSSGTTGKPKAITHRAGGMLLQLAKEHLIHGGMTPRDVFFQYTTPGWMMWNFLVAGLVSGAPLVLFDGSPLRPSASSLWSLADKLGITVFGTSAAYLAALEKSGCEPRREFPSLKVRQVLSTGSPLRADLYPFIMKAVGPDTLIGSITGGTDICSLFAGHNVALPVRAGEIQARNLGMAVQVYSDAGKPLGAGSPGDLVCTKPFPAQPLGFWGQASEDRHRETYYSTFDNVWYHGDYVVLTEHHGLVMLGRSDGVLNPGGIRFGSSEIYEVVAKLQQQQQQQGDGKTTAAARIQNSLVCGLKTPKGDDEVVVLFLVVEQIDDAQWQALVNEIKSAIRRERSPRHVPRFVRRVKGVPLTMNGKLAEVPAKKLLNGASIEGINKATLSNPDVLTEYVDEGRALRSQLS